MADRHPTRSSIVEWDRMKTFWRRNTFAAQYFGSFISMHPHYEFTVAQAYHGLYTLGVTCEQYDTIKREIARNSRFPLSDVYCTELLKNGDVRKKSFKTNQEYQAYLTDFVQTNNRRLVREKQDEVKVHYEKITRKFKERGDKSIVSFDLEVYEYNDDKVLEVGFIIVSLSPGAPVITDKRHFIIEENLQYKNKDHVKDNRNGFRFGESQTVPLAKAMEEFRRAVQSCTFVVGHSVHDDQGYLKGNGLDLLELKKEIADTQVIQEHKDFETMGVGNRRYISGLKKLLEKYGVRFREADLHNAACDAYYTMKVFLRQMGHGIAIINSL